MMKQEGGARELNTSTIRELIGKFGSRSVQEIEKATDQLCNCKNPHAVISELLKNLEFLNLSPGICLVLGHLWSAHGEGYDRPRNDRFANFIAPSNVGEQAERFLAIFSKTFNYYQALGALVALGTFIRKLTPGEAQAVMTPDVKRAFIDYKARLTRGERLKTPAEQIFRILNEQKDGERSNVGDLSEAISNDALFQRILGAVGPEPVAEKPTPDFSIDELVQNLSEPGATAETIASLMEALGQKIGNGSERLSSDAAQKICSFDVVNYADQKDVVVGWVKIIKAIDASISSQVQSKGRELYWEVRRCLPDNGYIAGSLRSFLISAPLSRECCSFVMDILKSESGEEWDSVVMQLATMGSEAAEFSKPMIDNLTRVSSERSPFDKKFSIAQVLKCLGKISADSRTEGWCRDIAKTHADGEVRSVAAYVSEQIADRRRDAANESKSFEDFMAWHRLKNTSFADIETPLRDMAQQVEAALRNIHPSLAECCWRDDGFRRGIKAHFAALKSFKAISYQLPFDFVTSEEVLQICFHSRLRLNSESEAVISNSVPYMSFAIVSREDKKLEALVMIDENDDDEVAVLSRQEIDSIGNLLPPTQDARATTEAKNAFLSRVRSIVAKGVRRSHGSGDLVV